MRELRFESDYQVMYPSSGEQVANLLIECGFSSLSGLELIELINGSTDKQLSPLDRAQVVGQWRNVFDVEESEKVDASKVGEWLYSRSNYETYS